MNTLRENLEDGIQDTVKELRTMRDEIRVRIHLGSMDARDAWKKLEPRFDDVERDLEHGGEAVRDVVLATVDELRSGFRALREELKGGSPL